MRPKQGGSWVAAVPSALHFQITEAVLCDDNQTYRVLVFLGTASLGGMEFWCRGVCVGESSAQVPWLFEKPPRLEIFHHKNAPVIWIQISTTSPYILDGLEFLESESRGAFCGRCEAMAKVAGRIAEDFSWQDLSFLFHSQGWRIQCQYYDILYLGVLSKYWYTWYEWWPFHGFSE